MSKDILYPLRRLHGSISEKISQHRDNQRFYKSVLVAEEKKVLLIGTPTHTNIGDSAIVLAEYAFLEKCGVAKTDVVEITFEEFCKLNYSVRKILKKCSLICWHGGGNMGTIWPREEILRQKGLRKLPRSCPTFIFPQTIFYDDSQAGQREKKRSIAVYDKRSELTIAAREEISFKTMREIYPNTKIIVSPDIVLSLTTDVFCGKNAQREGILLCLRADKERALGLDDRETLENYARKTGERWEYTDMRAECSITPENRLVIIRKKMLEFATSKLVITDRLHGMVFAALTGTPCVVLANNNHKVTGTYQWIRHLPYVRFADSIEQVESWIPELLDMGGQTFDNRPLIPYYEELARVVRQYVNN